jgi:predicted transcriptional regulator
VQYTATKNIKNNFTLRLHCKTELTANKDILINFGENLRSFRRQKGLSLRALYAICGIDHGMLSRMENGKINVTLKTVAILADALEVPYWKLIKPD